MTIEMIKLKIVLLMSVMVLAKVGFFVMVQRFFSKNIFNFQRDYQVVFTRLQCTNNDPQLVADWSCRLVTINNRTRISGNFRLHKILTKLPLKIFVDYERDNGKRIKVFDSQMNRCALLSNSVNNELMKIWFSSIFKNINIVPDAPYKR